MHIPGLRDSQPFPAPPAAVPSIPAQGLSTPPASFDLLQQLAATESLLSAQSNEGAPGISQFAAVLLDVYQAFASGNLESAKTTFDSLKRTLSSSEQTLTFSPGGLAETPLLGNLVSQIETSLHSGNLSSAQSSLDAFLQGLSSGIIANTSGWMPLSPAHHFHGRYGDSPT